MKTRAELLLAKNPDYTYRGSMSEIACLRHSTKRTLHSVGSLRNRERHTRQHTIMPTTIPA